MKKTAIALLTLTGLLLAGCSQVSSENISPSVPEKAAQMQQAEDVILSDSNEEIIREETPAPIVTQTPAVQNSEGKDVVDEKTSQSAKQPKETEQPVVHPTKKPDSTPKPSASKEIATTKPPEESKPTEQPEVPKSTATSKPTPAPTPEPIPMPQPEMEIMGGHFNNAVLQAINAARAENGNAPLTLDSGLCEKALAHAKEMAKRGEIFHSCGGAESVSNSNGSGSMIGTRSAAHATGIALDADRSRLGVGSVKIGDKQYTCVFSPRD